MSRGHVARDALGLVELEPEVHPALEVEAELEGHPGLGGVAHGPVGAARADRDLAREEAVHGERHQEADDEEPVSNRVLHRC